MSRDGGIKTPISAQMIQAAQEGLLPGQSPTPGRTGWEGWFGPGTPQPAAAPPQVEGRQFELPVGVNLVNTRKTEGISHAQLRIFADACDIVRMLIETRKDQICGRAWNFVVKEQKPSKAKPARGTPMEPEKEPDSRLVELTSFFRKPDKVHTFSEWARMMLEDLMVLDAPCCYIQKTLGGGIYAFRPVDGSTIKRLIDLKGWAPAPPEFAYQQILLGVVATSFTVEELVYKPRNVRTHKIYGYSQVEQVIVTAQMWLKRQASNLEYYDSGNLPEGFLQGAEGWTPEQLQVFQLFMDTMLSGNYAERRKVRVVPFDAEYQAVKEPALKAEFDEWLARIACFCFGYPPTPFIKQMNRSTSDNDAEAGDEEGEAPIAQWFKEFMDQLVQDVMGYVDIEFMWEDKEEQDPKVKADIDVALIGARVLDPNEVRAEMGLAPLPPPEPTVVDQDGNPVGGGGFGGGKPPPGKPKPGDDKKKLGKAASEQGDGVDLDSPFAVAQREALAKELATALSLTADEAIKEIEKYLLDGERSAQIICGQLSLAKLKDVEVVLSKALTDVAQEAAGEAAGELSVGLDIDLVNERAAEWAGERAAALIGKDAFGGELAEATRASLRTLVEQAIAEGWSNPQLAKALRQGYGFSKARANTIARTETAFASLQGSMAAWVASGVVKRKVWLLSQSEGVCDVCGGNVGDPIPLLATFKSGDLSPPAHPNCRCSLAPIVTE